MFLLQQFIDNPDINKANSWGGRVWGVGVGGGGI